jgi:hypothetical protein
MNEIYKGNGKELLPSFGVGRKSVFELSDVGSHRVSFVDEGAILRFIFLRAVTTEGKRDIRLVYLTLQDLGFDKPESLEKIFEKLKGKKSKGKMVLDDCPTEVGVSLADAIQNDSGVQVEQGTYYVVSKKPEREEEVGKKDGTPDFLGFNVSEDGNVSVFSWNRSDEIPIDARIVFAVAK